MTDVYIRPTAKTSPSTGGRVRCNVHPPAGDSEKFLNGTSAHERPFCAMNSTPPARQAAPWEEVGEGGGHVPKALGVQGP